MTLSRRRRLSSAILVSVASDAEGPTWRPRAIARVAGGLVVLLALLLAIGFTVSPPSATGYVPAVVFWLMVPIVAFGVWRNAFVAHVACMPEGLRVRNASSEVVIPWAEIVSVKPTYWGLWITERDGRIVTARAVQKSNAATWLRRRTRADRIAATIEAYAQSHA